MFGVRHSCIVMSLIAVAAFISACGGSSAPVVSPGTGPVAAPTTAPQSGQIAINGAGATFPYPLYSRWFHEYNAADKSVQFNYQSIGSGGGIAQITQKTVDFGTSDAILNAEQEKAAPGLQMFPTVAGAVVPTYTLKDADGQPITAAIKFPRDSVADIFLGQLTKWNDPVLAQANPDIKLPAKDIIVVHRSDGSGTTFIFTDYLSKVSSEWSEKVGKSTSVKWPTGLGGKGNEGVAGTVAQNDGAIGYVELAYAKQNKLPYGQVQNKAGEFVSSTPESIQAAMADFGTEMGDKLAISITDAPGKASWPIAGYTYLLLYMDQTDCAKASKMVSFVKWAYTDGAKYAVELDYVPLPDAVKTQVLSKLDQITCAGKPL